MGQTAENLAQLRGLDRKELDEFGVRSQNLAEKAIADGFWEREITPVTAPDGTVVTADDGPRAGVTYDAISQLKPVFRPDGVVTAGNCCPLNDGAAAVVIMSDTKAAELGLTPLARIVSTGVSGLSPEIMGLGPVEASKQALALAGMTIGDIDLVEINEAFAAQVMPSYQDLGIDLDKLNVNGGAIAVGHPFGMTGARLTEHDAQLARLARQVHRPDHHVRRRRPGHGPDPRAGLATPRSRRTPGPGTAARRSAASSVPAGRSAPDHSTTRRRSFFPEDRGRQVPTTSCPSSSPPGRPSVRHRSLRAASSGTTVSRSRACRNRSNGPSIRTPSTSSAPVSASTSAASIDRSSPSTSTVVTSSGHRAATSRTGESTYAATCRGVAGPRRCSTARTGSRWAGTRAAGPRQPGIRRSTGGDVPGSSSSPARSSDSRNGCS